MAKALLNVTIMAMCLVCLCTGCLHSSDPRMQFYNRCDSAVKAINAGKYDVAAPSWYEAYQQSDLYAYSPQVKASCAYNLAICLGQLGKYEEAEGWFRCAMDLEERIEGDEGAHASSDWFELARLYQAWGRYEDSIKAYEKAFPIEAKCGYDKIHPEEDVIIWNDYAKVLQKAGYDDRAKIAMAHAQKIKDALPWWSPLRTGKPAFRYYPILKN